MLVPTGSWVAIGGTTAAAEPVLNGTVSGDEIVQARWMRAGRPVLVLECQDRVVESTQERRMHLYFRVRRVVANETGGPVRLDRITRFPGQVPTIARVDSDWRRDGLGSLAPAEAGYLQPDASFRFAPNAPAVPADGTRFMYVRTGAQRFGREARIQVVVHADPGVLDSPTTLVQGFGPA